MKRTRRLPVLAIYSQDGCSFISLWKGYYFPMEGIRKGYLFCQKWYIKVGGRTSGRSFPVLNIFSTTPPPPGKTWRLHYWTECWIYRLWTVVNGQWSQKKYFNHCLTGWNSFHIDLQAEESEFRRHVWIWTKWKHFFGLFLWTGTLLHLKWSETTYLRDKQEKSPGYA